MFGNGMMKKIQAMQEKAEEAKERLNHIKLIGEAKEGAVRIEVNGNGVITEISWKDELQGEELKQLIIMAANRALEQANRTKEMEMAQAAKGIIPGM
ncbi:MAG: YbaB/EbfC family nucleoid-associated protein [Crocinitomix sp.]|nr:YbaB/EbfC family nucleoid-associated protein [Crocinitomix sp.]|tara:strand:- start:860 stop:1150 length:291 start_codon:yes stop_codon:yes gene_type:complete